MLSRVRVLGFSANQLLLALATAVGAFGGFPRGPAVLQQVAQTELGRWAAVFVLAWQGGAQQDVKLAGLVTAALYAATRVLV